MIELNFKNPTRSTKEFFLAKKLQIKNLLTKLGNFLHYFFNLHESKGKFPNPSQWQKIPRVLNFREKIIFSVLITLFLTSSLALFMGLYLKNTEIRPTVGGEYSEAQIGQPRFINPLFSSLNDADRDLSELIFSGLFKYDFGGNIVPDLAENFQMSDDGKTYDVYLKRNVKWHDGAYFSADDIIFTIQSFQDPKIQSPQRINWQGVSVEKIDDFHIKFTLTNAYAPFIENLTLKILPKHIWEDVLPQNFTLADFNLKPIGSGPFRFKKFQKDKFGFIKSYTLEPFNDYLGGQPYLKKIEFLFFENEEMALKALSKKEALGLASVSPQILSQLKEIFNVHSFFTPRYFALFFNQNQSKTLADKNVRIALSYALNKNEVVAEILSGGGAVMNSALPPSLEESSQDIKIYDFSPQHSREILEKNGWKDTNEDGWREKIITQKVQGVQQIEEEIPLEITLSTVETSPLVELTQMIKEQWQKIGVKVNIEFLSPADIQQDKIRPRNYQALLFGEVLGMIPDPFSFWHSSQKKDPGLNLSLYDNKTVDKLLEEARQTNDAEIRSEKYKKFQQAIAEDIPAIFLYSPMYLYAVSKSIKGIEVNNIADPSKRFMGVENWYVKTKRAWK